MQNDTQDNTREMIPNADQETGQAKNNNPILLFSVGAVLMLLVAGAVAYYFIQYMQRMEMVDPFAELSGKVYVSLAPIEGGRGSEGHADINEYILDVQSGTLKQLDLGDEWLEVTSSVSPNGDLLAVMTSPFDPNAPAEHFYPATIVSQLYVYDLSTGERTKITDNPDLQKRQPKWSPDGRKIVFYSKPDIESDLHDPLNWAIYVTDLDGNTNFVSNGVQPFWSPDGNEILFIGADGLYTYNFRTGEEEQVHIFGIPVDTLMKFDLSNDKSLFARSYPLGNNITIFKIQSWEPFAMQPIDQIDIEGYAATYWPKFSPDNRYLLFQWGDYEPETKTFFDFQLMVYDLTTGQRKTVYDMEAYRFDVSFINDWVK